MSGHENWDEFEQDLSASLRARSEPPIIADLATRALERAAVLNGIDLEERTLTLQRIGRQRHFSRLATAAALVMIGVVLWFGGQRYLRWSQALAADAQSSDSTTLASSSDGNADGALSTMSTSTTTTTIASTRGAAFIGGLVLAVALILMALDRAFAADSRATGAARLAGSHYWGAAG